LVSEGVSEDKRRSLIRVQSLPLLEKENSLVAILLNYGHRIFVILNHELFNSVKFVCWKGGVSKMVDLQIEREVHEIIRAVERLTGIELPREILKVVYNPKLDVLLIRFRKAEKCKVGEPVYPGVILYRDDEDAIIGLEIVGYRDIIRNLLRM